MSRSRRNFSAEFKTNLVLQLLKGEKELNDIAPTPLYFSYNIIVIFCYLPPKILRNQSQKSSVPRYISVPPFPFILLSNPLHFQLFCDKRRFFVTNGLFYE